MTRIELVAALFGMVSVYLGTRQNILSWPTAIVNVALYVVVFHGARLYADMGLQVVYLLLSFYGWYQWLYGGNGRTPLAVSRATTRQLISLGALNLVAWVALASLLTRHTDAVLPWLDSLLTTTSLVAQWMMTRKILESWIVWIVVDVAYVPMFVSRGLFPTAFLYAVFLGLAVMGYREWQRSWAARQVANAP